MCCLKTGFKLKLKAGNRFATILLYMSDLEDKSGGETVFTKGSRGDGEAASKEEVVRLLRESAEIDSLEPGSWEEDMVIQCRSKLAIVATTMNSLQCTPPMYS